MTRINADGSDPKVFLIFELFLNFHQVAVHDRANRWAGGKEKFH